MTGATEQAVSAQFVLGAEETAAIKPEVPKAAPLESTPCSLAEVTATIASASVSSNGTTYYDVVVEAPDHTFSVKRRYKDFIALHEAVQRRGLKPVMKLPSKGLMGVRHRLNLGTFNSKRHESLKAYLESLTRQIRDIPDTPLNVFLYPSEGSTVSSMFPGSFMSRSSSVSQMSARPNCEDGTVASTMPDSFMSSASSLSQVSTSASSKKGDGGSAWPRSSFGSPSSGSPLSSLERIVETAPLVETSVYPPPPAALAPRTEAVDVVSRSDATSDADALPVTPIAASQLRIVDRETARRGLATLLLEACRDGRLREAVDASQALAAPTLAASTPATPVQGIVSVVVEEKQPLEDTNRATAASALVVERLPNERCRVEHFMALTVKYLEDAATALQAFQARIPQPEPFPLTVLRQVSATLDSRKGLFARLLGTRSTAFHEVLAVLVVLFLRLLRAVSARRGRLHA